MRASAVALLTSVLFLAALAQSARADDIVVYPPIRIDPGTGERFGLEF